MLIDPRFLDVDFESEARTNGYATGNLGRNTQELFAAPSAEDRLTLIPRGRWRELCAILEEKQLGMEWLITRIYNQRSEGSCVANACCQAHEIVQAQQLGPQRVIHLSAISLYKRIGRSPNSGAYVDDGLKELRDGGVLPLDTPANRVLFGEVVMPNTGYYTAYPAGWQATAAQFRADEWYRIESLDALVSAQLYGYPVVVGRRGHSICYVRPFYDGNRLYQLYVNSWGEWGQAAGRFKAGFGVDSEGLMHDAAGWAFALRTAIIPNHLLD